MNKSHPQIIESEDGKNIFYRNKFLYTDKNIDRRVKSKLESLDISDNTLIIVPSPLFYHGAETLIKSTSINCRILFVEHDRELYYLSENPFTNYSSILLEDDKSLAEYSGSFDFSDIRKIIIFPLNNGYFINRIFYNRVFEYFRSSLSRFWKNKITMISLSSRWYSNIFKNLPCYSDSYPLSSLKMEGPVFLAGAGESVEKALPLIKKYRESFTLVSIDTAVNTLINYDIVPDYILAVESQFYNIYDFYSCKNLKIPLICDISCYPETLRITNGNNYFFFSGFSDSPFLKWMEKSRLLPDKIPPLGSVGVTALYISLMLTDSSVIYSGLDFSFVPGKSHSKDSPFLMLTSLLKKRTDTDSNYSFCMKKDTVRTLDLNGNTVYTNSNLKSYCSSFREITSSTERIYSLFPSGIAEIRNTLLSEKDLTFLLDKSPSVRVITEKKSFSPDYSDFYRSEHFNIKKIIDYSVDFLNSRADSSVISDLRKLLMFSGYLTEDFPENSIPAELTSPYLKRVLLSCYRYERIMKDVLNTFYQ